MDDLPLATAHADAWPANGSCGLYFSLSRCPSQRFSQTPQILYCGCQQELIVRTVYAPQAQAVQLQNALEMGKQHFHFLPVPARISVYNNQTKKTHHNTSRFMNAAWNLP